MFLVAVVVATRPPTALAPDAATTRTTAVLEAADADLAVARAVIPEGIEAEATVCVGSPGPMLEREAVRLGADTVAMGSHGHGRSAGILLGSVATRLIHHAPCSVLVARAMPTQPFPRSIAVGVDGSEHSLHALQEGRELARRIGVPLRVLHVLDGAIPRGALQAEIGEEVEELTVAWSVAEGLSAHVTPADLLIVGSRGLHGIRALGSVSEAVAHQAPSSVLIVRQTDPTPHARTWRT
jgi:nucleotide-binding universal stress UspA family protein